jgi:hypothetical protein
LVSQTTTYFITRGFEKRTNAEVAAREFIEFCRGRLWVFTEAGTTARGEPVYAFTHRTFLEYFAAAYLASIYDSPEQLARKLSERLARSEWDTVAQLAVQIKDHASERGAERVFQTLLTSRRYRSAKAVGNILGFLGRCTAFAEPTPTTVQELAAQAFRHALADISDEQLVAPLAWLMVSVHGDLRKKVAAELESQVRRLVESKGGEERILGLRLALQLNNAPFAIQQGDYAWHGWDISSRYQQELIQASESADDIAAYMCFQSETASSILARRSDLPHFLFEMTYTHFIGISWFSPARNALSGIPDGGSHGHPLFRYLSKLLSENQPPPPIAIEKGDHVFGQSSDGSPWTEFSDMHLAMDTYRSAAYMACVFAESVEGDPPQATGHLGGLSALQPYLLNRWVKTAETLLPLPVDKAWQEIFTKWATKEINFTLGGDRTPGSA